MSTDLWQRSLERLQQQFEQKGASAATGRCRLAHAGHAEREYLKADPDPGYVSGSFGGYGLTMGVPCDTNGKLVYSDSPSRIANGESFGQGAHRDVVFLGSQNVVECQRFSESVKQWTLLAEQAGASLESLPGTCIASISLDSLFESKRWLRWVYCLFDLAWQKRHPTLAADRNFVFRFKDTTIQLANDGNELHAKEITIQLPYDLNALREWATTPLAMQVPIPSEWLNALPEFFESELSDIFLASAAAIDLLLLDGGIGAEQPSPDGPWSQPDSPSQWAKKFKVSLDTLTRWEKAGKIKVRKLTTKSWQIRVADLPGEPPAARK